MKTRKMDMINSLALAVEVVHAYIIQQSGSIAGCGVVEYTMIKCIIPYPTFTIDHSTDLEGHIQQQD